MLKRTARLVTALLFVVIAACPGTGPGPVPLHDAIAVGDGSVGVDSSILDANPGSEGRPADARVVDVGLLPDAPVAPDLMVPDSKAAPTFTDVPSTHLAYAAISWVGARGIMLGCKTSPLAFCPDDPLKRDQLAVTLMRMKFGATFSYSKTPSFSDVPSGHWAFAAIQKLYELKLTAGCGAGKFCPADDTLRNQAAVFLVRAKYGNAFTYNQTPFFADVPNTHLSFKYIQKLRQENITKGCGSGKYCPALAITRAQWAVFLYGAKTL